MRRFGAGASNQHALVRLARAGLTRVGSDKPLDIETLDRVAGRRAPLAYLRIDPLKVDVGKVADVMSALMPSATACCRCRSAPPRW